MDTPHVQEVFTFPQQQARAQDVFADFLIFLSFYHQYLNIIYCSFSNFCF